MGKEYILKHKDIDVAFFNIDPVSNNVDNMEILDSNYIPINTKASDISQIVTFNSWLTDRCISNSREGVERLRNYYNINDLKLIMLSQHGLSLSDHFWIEKEGENNKWKNINLFENDYNDVLGKVLFDKKIKLVQEISFYGYRNPNITTGGNLKKYWKRDEKTITNHLIKGGSKPDYQEPFNEYFAHLLLKELKYDHVEYNVEKHENEYVSICPCIADINKEMISAVDICRKHGIEKTYNGFIDIGEKKGCTDFKHDVNKMIILDFLIDNIDRHWNNFGILRDSDSASWQGLIPLFDNGNSLWNKDFVNPKIISESMSFADSNEECLKYVNIEEYLKNVPNMVDIFDAAFENYESKERKKDLRLGLSIKYEEMKKYV